MAELLATTSSQELSEWMAYERIEPFGENRSDLRAGIIASTVQNSAGRSFEQISKPTDFMPFHQNQEEDKRTAEGAILDEKPEAQSALIMAAMFGIAPGE